MNADNAKSKEGSLTVRQVRAARALLAWSQQDLAKAAGVAQSTVADFERGRRTPVPNNIEAMRTALTEAGVRFPPGGAVIGPTIDGLGPGKGGTARFRWVNAIDIEQWSERREGQGALPTLLAQLIRAAAGPAASLRFPADEGVHHSGWDGITEISTECGYAPAGLAGWEIGAQRAAIARKAQDEFEKRSAAPAPLDPAVSTFVFVTPRHWPGKDAWAKARRAEGPWRDVRAYDVDDLVHWIEQYPAVGLWLAIKMGRRPEGAHQLSELWREWSLATEWPITEDLVLSDRDEDAAFVQKWLRARPATLALKGESADDVAAFFYAVVTSLPEDIAEHYLARAIVADDTDAARRLADNSTPLIIVLLDPEPGLAQATALAGHHVLLAYGDRPHGEGETRVLARPSREGIETALTNAGIPSARAEILAKDCARSLAVLRRLIPSAPGRLPKWAEGAPPRSLIAALLAGAWSAKSPGDRAILQRLAGGLDYETIEVELAEFVGKLDSPLRKSGPAWRVASPRDAWFLLAKRLTVADIDRYQSAVVDVLGAVDPRYGLDADARWSAELDGVKPDYSGWLRLGLGEVLILLALFGDRTLDAADGSARARAVVRSLLYDASPERWWSLSRDFRLLAEAAPDTFLDAVNRGIDRGDQPIKALFETDDRPFGGGEHLSDLLWALEALAWSKSYLGAVVDVLARLDEIDPGGQFSNRPSESLRRIFLLWSPQTSASLDERLRLLRRLMDKRGDPAWKLLLAILPKSHDMTVRGSTPRWRDFSGEEAERVTYQLLHRGAVEITKLVIEHAGDNLSRWTELIERLNDLAPSPDNAIGALGDVLARSRHQHRNDGDAIEGLRAALRQVLHRHRQFPNVEWSLKEPALGALEKLYDSLEPGDLARRFAWLFRHGVHLPNPAVYGWREQEEEVQQERRRAVCEVLETGGVDTLFEFSRSVERPGFVGGALALAEVDDGTLNAVLERALRSNDQRDRDLAYGMTFMLFRDRREKWAERLLSHAQEWGAEALVTILLALPNTRWTWDRAREAGPAVEQEYWRRAALHWIDGDAADHELAARKLISAGRARHAVHLLGHDRAGSIASAVLVEILQEAANKPFESQDGNEPTMFRYSVAQILKALDDRDDVDPGVLIRLEWLYLPLLEYSERPPQALSRALSEQPEFFVEVLRAAFKPSEESGIVEPEPESRVAAEAAARRAWDLFRLWDRIPGTDEEGKVDARRLKAWLRDARRLAAECGRAEIADIKIGEMFSASPAEKDGSWPLVPIRDEIEELRSEELERGFAVGIYNRRGVTVRGMQDGGAPERNEAARYRDFARAAAIEWPRVAAVLERVAADYEIEARRHDEESERQDWR